MARPTKSHAQVLRSLPRSRKINRVSIRAEMLFVRLLLMADVNGRYFGSPFRVASLVLAERLEAGDLIIDDVALALDELDGKGLITRYEVEGTAYLEIVRYYRTKNAGRAEAQHPGPRVDGGGPHLGDVEVPNGVQHPGDLTETETYTETERARGACDPGFADAVSRLCQRAYDHGVASTSLDEVDEVIAGYVRTLAERGYPVTEAEELLADGMDRVRATVIGEKKPGRAMLCSCG